MIRGAGCGSPARPDLREPRAGDRPGPPDITDRAPSILLRVASQATSTRRLGWPSRRASEPPDVDARKRGGSSRPHVVGRARECCLTSNTTNFIEDEHQKQMAGSITGSERERSSTPYTGTHRHGPSSRALPAARGASVAPGTTLAVAQHVGVEPTLPLTPQASRGREHLYARRRPEESVLYTVVQTELEGFLLHARARDRAVPRFVERELRACLACGILAHGFVRVRCDACACERLVAFSCRGRAFCPSCGGRRMADTAAHLVDRVLPRVPIRQWVLSLPFALRYRLAFDGPLTSAILGLFLRTVFSSLRRRARLPIEGRRSLQCGAVTFVQRFGDALNLNVHFHSLVVDGVYARDAEGRLRFHPLPPPDDAEVARLAREIARRIGRLLERRGLHAETEASDADPLPKEQPFLASLYAASVGGRLATGRRAGRRMLRVGDRIDPDALPLLEGERCASVDEVSLHANVAVPARDRTRLERLCRYVARPPVATDRLSRLEDGRLLYRLKHRWRDGTTHVVFEPRELVEKLAALVPPPRFHTARYHGVFGPCASTRGRVVPCESETVLPTCNAHAEPHRAHPGHSRPPPASAHDACDLTDQEPSAASAATPYRNPAAAPDARPPSDAAPRPCRLSWSELLHRVFAMDVLQCPDCGSRMHPCHDPPARGHRGHPHVPRAPGACPTDRAASTRRRGAGGGLGRLRRCTPARRHRHMTTTGGAAERDPLPPTPQGSGVRDAARMRQPPPAKSPAARFDSPAYGGVLLTGF